MAIGKLKDGETETKPKIESEKDAEHTGIALNNKKEKTKKKEVNK